MTRRWALGAGPFVVGWRSDGFAPAMGEESIRWALVLPLALNLVGAFCYARASRHYGAELARAR